MIDRSNIVAILEDLDKRLAEEGEFRDIVVFGSAALFVQGMGERQTVDIDMVEPEIDNTFQILSAEVGEKYQLEFGWLNSAGHIFSRKFPRGWKGRVERVFEGKALTVSVLARADLVATKLYAACQRGRRDIDDLLAMAVTQDEVKQGAKWVKGRENGSGWSEQVKLVIEEILSLLKKGTHE
jgi:hypothetical protein